MKTKKKSSTKSKANKKNGENDGDFTNNVFMTEAETKKKSKKISK